MGTTSSTDTVATPRKRAPRKAVKTPAVKTPAVKTPAAVPPPVASDDVTQPALVDTPDVGAWPEYPRDFEPIPGINLDGISKIVADARRTPATADVVIDGMRALIRDNGHDPDVIIAAAVGAETEAEPEEQPDGLVNATIDFRGRMIKVTAPAIEQVMVIRRMQSMFANAAKMDTMTAEEALTLMDRALMAICTVVVDEEDVVYLENLLLTRQAKLDDLLPILRESMQALERANADSGNRADRRSAAKSAGRSGRAALATDVE